MPMTAWRIGSSQEHSPHAQTRQSHGAARKIAGVWYQFAPDFGTSITGCIRPTKLLAYKYLGASGLQISPG
jgi:hypothetical protein